VFYPRNREEDKGRRERKETRGRRERREGRDGTGGGRAQRYGRVLSRSKF